MKPRVRLTVASLVVGVLVSTAPIARLAGESATRATDAVSEVHGEDSPTDLLRLALEHHASVDFNETRLDHSIKQIAALLGVTIVIDEPGFQNAMVDREQPITLKANDIPARSALALLLEPSTLVCIPHNDVLFVTDKDSTTSRHIVRIYPVGDLVAFSGAEERLAATLIEELQSLIDQNVWARAERRGVMRYLRLTHTLDVSAPADTQERIYTIINSLRRARKSAALLVEDPKPAGQDAPPGGDAQTRAEQNAAEAKRMAEFALRATLRMEIQLANLNTRKRPGRGD